jgi:hypothetical protein
MKNFTLLIFLVLFGITGCSKQTTGKPPDFSATLDWQTGSLPQPYQYSYRVLIGPLPGGELHYTSADNSKQLTEPFTVTEEQLSELYKYLVDRGALRSNWNKGDPIDGGPVTYISIIAGKKNFFIPERSELAENERSLVDDLVAEIRSIVPKPLWEEMNRLQLECEIGFENNLDTE